MNDQPHVHEVRIRENSHYWSISYGDQTKLPDYPWLLRFDWWRRARLRFHVRGMIRAHDRASLHSKACRAFTVAALRAAQACIRIDWVACWKKEGSP